MKIPTVLGLALLIVAIALGIFLFKYKQKVDQDKKINLTPNQIQIANITGDQLTITWQTSIPTIGSVIYDKTVSLNSKQVDDRDKETPLPRLTHFVTIQNLQPETKYLYKIQSDKFSYPDKPSQFSTAKAINEQFVGNKPILGTVLDPDLKPVDEALVFLKLSNGSSLATYTLDTGNYILTLNNLRDSSLSSTLSLTEKLNANLLIIKGDLKSNIKIVLPPNRRIYPPVILGENSDLSTLNNSNPQFDLNGDGEVNSLDLSIIIKNFDQQNIDPRADLNQDGLVNQNDLDLIKPQLGQNPISK